MRLRGRFTNLGWCGSGCGCGYQVCFGAAAVTAAVENKDKDSCAGAGVVENLELYVWV